MLTTELYTFALMLLTTASTETVSFEAFLTVDVLQGSGQYVSCSPIVDHCESRGLQLAGLDEVQEWLQTNSVPCPYDQGNCKAVTSDYYDYSYTSRMLYSANQGAFPHSDTWCANTDRYFLCKDDSAAHSVSGYFTWDGDCQVEGNCVSSLNWPNNHGNLEACTVTAQRDLTLAVSSPFQIETCCDHLSVAGVNVDSVSSMPTCMLAGQTITWTTDYSVSGSGWQVCFEDNEAMQRTPEPTPQPTSQVNQHCSWSDLFPECYGADILEVYGVASLEDCKTGCETFSGCKFITWGHGRCIYKNGATSIHTCRSNVYVGSDGCDEDGYCQNTGSCNPTTSFCGSNYVCEEAVTSATGSPSALPSASPTLEPTFTPTLSTVEPTALPTPEPTVATMEPTESTMEPTGATMEPTGATMEPTVATQEPSSVPTGAPTVAPSSTSAAPTSAVNTILPESSTRIPLDTVQLSTPTESPTLATTHPSSAPVVGVANNVHYIVEKQTVEVHSHVFYLMVLMMFTCLCSGVYFLLCRPRLPNTIPSKVEVKTNDDTFPEIMEVAWEHGTVEAGTIAPAETKQVVVDFTPAGGEEGNSELLHLENEVSEGGLYLDDEVKLYPEVEDTPHSFEGVSPNGTTGSWPIHEKRYVETSEPEGHQQTTSARAQIYRANELA